MTSVKFNPELSLGNIITIITLVVGLTAGWQAITSEVHANRTELNSLAKRVSEVEDEAKQKAEQDHGTRVELTRVLTEMQQDIKYLRASVDEARGKPLRP